MPVFSRSPKSKNKTNMSNLFPCFDCGNNLSNNASSCPKCQTKRLRGTVCNACEKISKSSECISVLIDNKTPKKVSEKGEVKYFYNDETYKQEWFKKKLGDQLYYRYVDRGDRGIEDLKEMESKHEVFHFCETCYASIVPVGKVIEMPCVSCQEPFSINLEKYILGLEKYILGNKNTHRTCDSCGEQSNQWKFESNNLRKCFNCYLYVLIDEGIEIFNFEGSLVETEYVHKSCLNESIKQRELEIKRNQEVAARQNVEQKENELARQKEQVAHQERQIAHQEKLRNELIWQQEKLKELNQKRERIRLIRKVLVGLLIAGVAVLLVRLLGPKMAHSFYLLSKEKINVQSAILAFAIVGLIPIFGELCFLLSLIVLTSGLLTNSNNYTLALSFLMSIVTFLSISFRYVITGVFTKK
jgi:hypothetical protein